MSSDQEDVEESMDADSSDYGDDDDDNYDDYYNRNDGEDEGIDPNQQQDPECFDYSLLNVDETKELFTSLVSKASKEMQVYKFTSLLKDKNCLFVSRNYVYVEAF